VAKRLPRASAPSKPGPCRLFTVAALTLAALPAAIPNAHAETSAVPAPVPQVDLDRLKRQGDARPSGDLFNSRSWEPRVRPSKAAPPPPPPPSAPPLPFAYVGRWLERGQTIVVLSRNSQHYIAQAGEQLDSTYILESVETDKLVIRYLPLGIAQVLPFSNGSNGNSEALPRPQPATEVRQRQKPTRDTDDEDD